MSAAVREDLRHAFALIAALTLARAVFLQSTPLNLYTDEAQYWAWAQALDYGYYSKPPLIAWIIAATTGLCGNGEACVRAASPFLHAVTALFIGLIGQTLAGPRAAFWSTLTYATLPGVFYSATLITTDVPLLAAWAAFTWALARLERTGSWSWAAAAGVAAGLGFLAKYAMLFAVPGVALYLVWTGRWHDRALILRLAGAAFIAALIALPNVLWNVANGFVTAGHIVELASPDRRGAGPFTFALEQIAIFGVIPTAAVAWRLATLRRDPLSDAERLLLALALPVLMAMLVDSATARAYGNWAAVAYVSLSVMAARSLLQILRTRWLAILTIAPVVLALAVWGALAAETMWRERGGCGLEVLDRHLGWDEAGGEVARRLRARPDLTLLAGDREGLARLAYYARLQPGQFAKWYPPARPDDHFALTARLAPGDPGPWLLASLRDAPESMLGRFDRVTPVGRLTVPLSVCRARSITFHELEGFRGY